jgi:hypothetical protein
MEGKADPPFHSGLLSNLLSFDITNPFVTKGLYTFFSILRMFISFKVQENINIRKHNYSSSYNSS